MRRFAAAQLSVALVLLVTACGSAASGGGPPQPNHLVLTGAESATLDLVGDTGPDHAVAAEQPTGCSLHAYQAWYTNGVAGADWWISFSFQSLSAAATGTTSTTTFPNTAYQVEARKWSGLTDNWSTSLYAESGEVTVTLESATSYSGTVDVQIAPAKPGSRTTTMTGSFHCSSSKAIPA